MYQKGETVVTEIDSYEKYCKSYTDDTNNGAKAEAASLKELEGYVEKSKHDDVWECDLWDDPGPYALPDTGQVW